MTNTEIKLAAVKSLVDACMAERGCSRLIAASYAAEACLAEYNRIQCDTGSSARSQIVDSAWLNVLLEEHANAGLPEVPGTYTAEDECPKCNCVHAPSEDCPDTDTRLPGEDMDGDAASALASAGMGTDEDYAHGTPID